MTAHYDTSLSLSTDTTITRQARPAFTFRYAYARSADSRRAGEPGQDYLALREDGHRLAFALCDGVSQSFFGDLAARLLGEGLAAWFWKRSAPIRSAEDLEWDLAQALHDLACEATQVVKDYSLPAGLPELLCSVLEEKRSLGSQSIFAAGLVDSQGRLLLAWMGDARLRLWGANGEEITAWLGDTFHTGERWSSLQGPIGELHTRILPLDQVHNLVVYSDGLARLDPAPLQSLSDQAIQEAIFIAEESATSDDISFLQVDLKPAAEPLPVLPPPLVQLVRQEKRLLLDWTPVDGATHYEIKVSNGKHPRQITRKTHWEIPPECIASGTEGNAPAIQVRAWQQYEPGVWSQPVCLPAVSVTQTPSHTDQFANDQAAEQGGPPAGRLPATVERELAGKKPPAEHYSRWMVAAAAAVLALICFTSLGVVLIRYSLLAREAPTTTPLPTHVISTQPAQVFPFTDTPTSAPTTAATEAPKPSATPPLALETSTLHPATDEAVAPTPELPVAIPDASTSTAPITRTSDLPIHTPQPGASPQPNSGAGQ